MSQLIMIIARIDDLDNPKRLTEVWRQAMPVVELQNLGSEQYLNGLEDAVMTIGWEAMRSLLVEQWRLTDQLLVAGFRQAQAGATMRDVRLSVPYLGYNQAVRPPGKELVIRLAALQLPSLIP